MRRLIKVLHEIGIAGLVGAIAAILILVAGADGAPPDEYAIVRRCIHDIARLMVVPSIGLVVFSGVLAIAMHHPFHSARWAWVKAGLGAAMLEGTLAGVAGRARDAATISRGIAEGNAELAGDLASTLRHERGVLWLILGVSLVSVVLGVWRPKLGGAADDSLVPPREADQ